MDIKKYKRNHNQWCYSYKDIITIVSPVALTMLNGKEQIGFFNPYKVWAEYNRPARSNDSIRQSAVTGEMSALVISELQVDDPSVEGFIYAIADRLFMPID